MTREQWKNELIEEIRKLRIPATRLYALLQLHPDEQHRGKDIQDIFEKVAREFWNYEQAGGIMSLLEFLHGLLANLPMPRSVYEIQKAHYQLTQIQECALNELLTIGSYIPYELPSYNDNSAKKTLEVIADVCHKWHVKIGPLRKELEKVLEEIPFIYGDEE